MNDHAAVEVIRTALAEELRGSPDARYLHRLHCVLLVVLGHRVDDVAAWFEIKQSTMTRWVRHFRQLGVEALRDDRRTGRPASLGPEQIDDIRQDIRHTPEFFGFAEGKRWNGKLLAAHLKSRYGILFSVRQCQRVLRLLRVDADPPQMAAEEPDDTGPPQATG